MESEPKPEKAGSGRAIVWALLALAILGAIVWWLTRDADERETLRKNAAELINEKTEGTLLAGVGDLLHAEPPPLPPEVLNPATEEGTLSGRVVEGTVGSPIDVSPGAGSTPQLSLDGDGPAAATTTPPLFSSEPLPPVSEDAKLKPDYLTELSQWLVSRYRPGPGGGTLGVSAQSLNSLLGVDIARRFNGGRSSLLRYALQPSMVRGLYNLYINKFMADLDRAAEQKGLSPEENRQFHLALGGKVLTMAVALDGTLAVPDLAAKLEKIESLGQEAVDLNARLAEVLLELDDLRAAKASATQLEAVRMRADGVTARYRRAMSEHREARQNLARQIRSHSGQTLDDDGLLFLAYWVRRRMDDDPEAAESLRGCALVMRDLARRCAREEEPS